MLRNRHRARSVSAFSAFSAVNDVRNCGAYLRTMTVQLNEGTNMLRSKFQLVLLCIITAVPQATAQTVNFDTAFFSGLNYRNVGPNRGGRSIAVAGSTSRPNEYYCGATGGGVWKTNDGGTTW